MILLISLFLILNSIHIKVNEKGYAFLLPFFFSLFLLILYFHEIQFLFHFTFALQRWIEITMLLYTLSTFFIQNVSNKNVNEYIVVLGCGLLDKKRISPMLMKRCDKAIKLYTQNKTKIIVSGGQGKDEIITEASAMKQYLLTKGIDEKDILCEEKAVSTKQNLLFVKDMIMDEFTIVSSDFHLLRIFLLSKKYHLHVYLHSSKCAPYYRIYAYLREYMAILWMYKLQFLILYFILFFLV